MVTIHIKTNQQLLSNPLLIPSLIFIIMLKHSIVTQAPLLQQPTLEEDGLAIQLFFEKELSAIEEENLKEKILKTLTDFFKMSEQEVNLRWTSEGSTTCLKD